YDYINGKKHSEANEANVCPQCDKFKSESKASRNDHYVRHHYDIYYSMVRESQFIEGWLNRNLGHAKLGEQSENLFFTWRVVLMCIIGGRRCLHCNGSRSHTGRLRLLKHMQTVRSCANNNVSSFAGIFQAHPDNFSALRTEYTAIPHIGKVKDKKLHQL
ncbi:hypothetical protein PRIPAC_72930, partial [Pristionchus pacificus]|uniref:Uncharacterized protein n=1 Tax=Pristionchus pacificus TaxID=54126 RepID=A0A2A6C7Q8_PRIPA